MANDAWKDWEDYNLGLQGTATGGAYNGIGLQDRALNRPANSQPYTPAKKQAQTKPAPTPTPHKSSGSAASGSGERTLQIWFFLGGCIASLCYMHNIGVTEPVSYLFGGLVAGALAGWLHKLIIALAIAAGTFYVLGQLNL